jgi:hypothetical protein
VERGPVPGEDVGAEVALRVAPHGVHVVDLSLGRDSINYFSAILLSAAR